MTLTDFDPEGEIKVVAAALYAASALPDDQLLAIARRLSADERAALLRAYVGQRDEPPAQAGPRVRADVATGSTCWPTTAPSAICSATGC